MRPRTVAVLGAGFMGSALAIHAARRGADVRLWGSRYDADLLVAIRAGLPHPRLEVVLPAAVHAHGEPELAAALRGADAVIVAVNSDAVPEVLAAAAPHWPPGAPLLCAAKGFVDSGPRVLRLSDAVGAQPARRAASSAWVALAGPAKAKELCRGLPTAMVAASPDAGARTRAREVLDGGGLWISETDDLAGVEACAAFKNAYATCAGLVDGLAAAGWEAAEAGAHNLKAALFALAVREIAVMAVALGGAAHTAHGLAGVGDLHVTAAAGRNHELGARVGAGQPPDEVAAEMRAARTLTEGYGAIATGWRLAGEIEEAGLASRASFPVLEALHRIVYRGASPLEVLSALPLRAPSPGDERA
jgi:glycerol-3-phosphate dehydrogenase (NAD(P)+)